MSIEGLGGNDVLMNDTKDGWALCYVWRGHQKRYIPGDFSGMSEQRIIFEQLELASHKLLQSSVFSFMASASRSRDTIQSILRCEDIPPIKHVHQYHSRHTSID